MYTSNFATYKNGPGAIAISAGVPRWYRGKRYISLAPPRAWITMNEQEYRPLYVELLSDLDPEQVRAHLLAIHDQPVLLCWERPGEFCHRRMVAEWLQHHLDITVNEYGQTTPLFTATD